MKAAGRLLLIAAVLVSILVFLALATVEFMGLTDTFAEGNRILKLWILFVAAEAYRRIVEPVVVGFRRRWKERGNREDPSDE